jgi:hypothetical protein
LILQGARPARKQRGSDIGEISGLIDVRYIIKEDIRKFVTGLCLQDVHGDMKALDLLGFKREAFKYESEVRLVYFDATDSECNADIFQFDLDPNEAFDEIILDPRITAKEARSLRWCLKSCGFKKPAKRSKMYESPKFTIPLTAKR